MSGEVVRVNLNDPDGRPIYIRGDDCVLRCDLIRAQLIHVQLGKAITAATAVPSAPKAGDPGRLSVKQRNYILVLCSQLSIVQRAFRLGVVSDVLGREVTTLNELTGDDAGRVIDYLQDARDRVDRVTERAVARTEEPYDAPF